MTIYRESVAAAFAKRHADSRKPLQRFLKAAAAAEWPDFVALRQTLSDS
jgi:hypothetical protein